jgi:Uma2 family endonuclease
MGMPHVARRYTVDEVLAFPSDGQRYELVRGELLVTPAPRRQHQFVVGEIFARLRTYLAEYAGVARVFLSPADISWADDVLVQPDVFVTPAEEAAGDWSDIRTLLLAVEVVSPTTARYDRIVKRAAYQEHGVPTYWIVDPDARLVEVWQPDDERPRIVTDILCWRVSPEVSELRIALSELFEAA